MRTTILNFDAKLTPRQEQITAGIMMGMCIKEIAAELFISPRTAEVTAHNAMERTGARKATDLVTWWFVTHFSIPTAHLPKSLIALMFLLLFGSYELAVSHDTIRTRTCRTEIRECRTRRNDDNPIIEF